MFPDADCVVRSNGGMVIMQSEQLAFGEQALRVILSPVAETTLQSYFDYHSTSDLVPLTTLFRTEDDRGWLEGGESADGRAGWFAFSSAGASPLWVAFFRASNPFIGGSLSATDARVQNSHGQGWSLSTDAPEGLVECS